MKNRILLVTLLLSLNICNAQMKVKKDDFRRHKGFYLSLSGGPNSANISSKVVNLYNLNMDGIGSVFDFKIGGAIKENMILHATLASTSMSGPKVTSSGKTERTSNNLTVGESMIGVGLTYYIVHSNYFFSSSVGVGNFTLFDSDNMVSVSTDRGFALQIKVGKEWWISKRWALGLAFTYGKTKLINRPESHIEEYMDSNNFGILFNATLN